jgi:prolyl-tRNA synthetase
VGPRDIAADQLPVTRRDKPHKESVKFSRGELVAKFTEILDEMQLNLYNKALQYREKHTKKIDTKEEFYQFFSSEKESGFALAHWSGEADVEKKIKDDLGVTIRCIPLDDEMEEGACVITGKKSKQRVIYAKSY